MSEDKLTNNELKILMDNLSEKFDKFENKFDKFCDRIEKNYVSKTEFKPIQKLVYGLVGLILSSIIIAILNYVIIK